jgi:hypothetical protein
MGSGDNRLFDLTAVLSSADLEPALMAHIVQGGAVQVESSS